MVKVKIFGVIRTTTGFGYIETEAETDAETTAPAETAKAI